MGLCAPPLSLLLLTAFLAPPAVVFSQSNSGLGRSNQVESGFPPSSGLPRTVGVPGSGRDAAAAGSARIAVSESGREALSSAPAILERDPAPLLAFGESGNGLDWSFLDPSVRYVWPTNAGRFLSSTFGETRSAHLHTGIDVKTWGREGYEVYSTRSGTVHRIQMGPGGYGNVIYVRHDDGSYSVYAHLRNFVPWLQNVADELRWPSYRHSIDADLSERNLRVEAGQLIAYTGSTGVGPAHLHFELRSPENIPVNPLYANFSIKDTRAPVIQSILVEAFDQTPEQLSSSGSLFDRPVTSSVLTPTTSTGRLFGTASVGGSTVAISVNVSDMADQVTNLYAVHRLELWQGDSLRFASVADAIPFELASHMFMDRHYPLLRGTDRKGYQRLHLLPGNRLPMYSVDEGQGWLELEAGVHRFTVRASDFAGNVTTGSFAVQVSGTGGVSKAKEALDLPVGAGRITSQLTSRITSLPDWASTIDTLLQPGLPHWIASPDQRLWMMIPSDALFGVKRIRLSWSGDASGATIMAFPEPMPFASAVKIGFLAPEGADLRNSGFRWLPTPHQSEQGVEGSPISTRKGDRVMTFTTQELGSFQIYSDTTAPSVEWPRRASMPTGRATYSIKVQETGSGLDLSSARFLIDGVRGIAEYDPDTKTFTFYHPTRAFSSAKRIEFTVRDGLGNRTQRAFDMGRAGVSR